jgi:UDP-glucose 4-epimerase
MNSLVVGGTGFIGKHLIDQLIIRGDAVTVYDRKELKSETTAECRFIRGGLNDQQKLLMTTKGIEIVYHLAWDTFPGTSIQAPIEDVISNVIGSINLLDACVKNDVRRIVFSSSGGTVYGRPVRLPVDENHFTDPISPYGITKLIVEKYIKLYAYLYDLKYVILRIANVYGEGQLPYRGQGVIPTFLARIYENKPIIIFGDGSIIRDYVYVTDVARAFFIAANDLSPNCIYNIGSSQEVSLIKLVEKIKTVTGKNISIRYEPARPFDVQKVILDCNFIKSKIGWDVKIDLDEGIKRTWIWIQSQMESILEKKT